MAPSAVFPAAAPSDARAKTVILTDAGKATWYDSSGKVLDAYIVGIAGGSASGKTSVARAITKSLPNVPWQTILSVDSFYKPLTPAQSKLAFENGYDFDHPNAFDYELLLQCISDLKAGRAVEIPNYSFVKHNRLDEKTYLYGANVILLEGLFVLQDPAIRALLDLKVFVQADSDLMLARRIQRDVKERGRDVEGILEQYLRFVKPSMDNFVSTTMKYADIIVPGAKNEVAIQVISQHIQQRLASSSKRIRSELSQARPPTSAASNTTVGVDSVCSISSASLPPTPGVSGLQGFSISPWGSSSTLSMAMQRSSTGAPSMALDDCPHSSPMLTRQLSCTSSSFLLDTALTTPTISGDPVAAAAAAIAAAAEAAAHLSLPTTVHLLPQTSQLRALLTILHDVESEGEEFIFHVNRLATLVVEAAMSLLPYRSKTVNVVTGASYQGREIDVKNVCSVSILRSGGVFETSLRRAIPDLALGSLLIQSADDGEPYLYSVRLPSFLRQRSTAPTTFVFLADAQIGTGAAAFMAIRVLLDHGVPQERIVFIALLASAKGGVHALAKAFPNVKVVVAGVDPGLRRTRVPVQRAATGSAPAASGGAGDTGRLRDVGLQAQVNMASQSDVPISDIASLSTLDLGSLHLQEGEQRVSKANHAGQGQAPSESDPAEPDDGQRTRVCWALLPGAGNVGNRYWRT
ncbi:uridine kinase [Tilletiaria anomala UBC 951]|uniref:Uridine kinase n=1 Tax=Tilletiaria anomala (strain ATCC 24038 / CBS 436.72 / UBC 951) TaxID=1037660 RepID=A0A066V9B6_TILAU|nr:uridine kinase [Tilletiaria anomala UBC 951]KDN38327.1 uridine kinase [Tilletiaria anomala UBC 951]